MKIKEIRAYVKDLGNKRPYAIAFKSIDIVNNAIVEIELENGIIGRGAGNPSTFVVGEVIESTISVLNQVDFLIGRDIREFYDALDLVQERLPKNPAARAALDIALHDAFTQFLDVPLGRFLGQKINSLPTSITIGIKNVSETLKEAKEFYEMGFRIFKIKTGLDVDEDIERINKLHESLPKGSIIRVDANQGYTEDQLIRFVKSTEAASLELIEQPLPAKNISGFKKMPDFIKNKIAIDESLLSLDDALLLATPPIASGIFNIKLMKAGGIYPARKIALVAKASSIDLMWGCNHESAISISAALHTALSYSNTKYLDLDGSLDLVEDVVKGGFKIKSGWMSITNKSGLGIN